MTVIEKIKELEEQADKLEDLRERGYSITYDKLKEIYGKIKVLQETIQV